MAGHEMASIYASAHPSNGQQTGIWLRSLAFMLKAFVWNRFSFGDFEVGMKWPRKNACTPACELTRWTRLAKAHLGI